jgi:plasmid stability protein
VLVRSRGEVSGGARQVRVSLPLDVHRWLRVRAAELDLSLADAVVVVLRGVVESERAR